MLRGNRARPSSLKDIVCMGNSKLMQERKPMRGARRAGVSPFLGHVLFYPSCLALALLVPLWQVPTQNPSPTATVDAQVQIIQPPSPDQATPPVTITLQDALER